jgi:hypothetical protein
MKVKIEESRSRLLRKIKSFQKQATQFWGALDEDDLPFRPKPSLEKTFHDDDVLMGDDDGLNDGNSDLDDEQYEEDGEDNDDEEVTGQVEDMSLFMPSSLGTQICKEKGKPEAMELEIQLREGQANDALSELRMALAHKAMLFRTKIRQAKSVKTKTRAWDDIHRSEGSIQTHVSNYETARQALLHMDALKPHFKVIKKQDLKLSGDVFEENRIGQKNDTLAWFWMTGSPEDYSKENNISMDECMYCLPNSFLSELICIVGTVFRITWLRAKAHYEQWKEEDNIVREEMKNTINFYHKYKVDWEQRASKSLDDGLKGHAGYASQQVVMWQKMGEDAQQKFSKVGVEISSYL